MEEDLDFSKICRVCLSEDTAMSLFTESMHKKLMFFASIQVWPSDGLPSRICNKCLDNVYMCFKFKKLCQKNDDRLRRQLTRMTDITQTQGTETVVDNVPAPEIVYVDCLSNDSFDLSDGIDTPMLCDDELPSTSSNNSRIDDQIEITDTKVVALQQIKNPEGRSQTGDSLKENQGNSTDIVTANARKIRETFECPTCYKRHATSKSLKAHIEILHHEARYKECTTCNKKFPESVYKTHLLTHSVENRPYECTICNKRFVYQQNMESHVQKHHSTDGDSNAIDTLLPVKSQEIYQKAFKNFMDWCQVKCIENYSESILISYFSEIAEKYKASSLWSYYSKLKSTLLVNKNVDISNFPKLIAFLKRKSDSYVPKKSMVLSRNQILKFITEAPDNIYLVTKIAVLMGIAGALRCQELLRISVDDIEDRGTSLFVNVKDTRTDANRGFYIFDNEETSVNFYGLYRKYASLRPSYTSHRRFFIYYKDGKCSTQVVGKNTLGKIPATIAKYLNLPNPQLYTGHCLRRSSTTMLASSGVNIARIKHRKSTSIVQDYRESSSENELEIATQVLFVEKDRPSTSTNNTRD